MPLEKLKHKDIKDYREKFLRHQGYKCALCNQDLVKEQAVLDHCHKTGQIRSVLHRGCNALLGKIENSLAINKITPEMLEEICKNVVKYRNTLKEFLHPTHKTPEDRKLARDRKKKLNKSAR